MNHHPRHPRGRALRQILRLAPGFVEPRAERILDPKGRAYKEAAGFVLRSFDGRSVIVTLRAGWLEFGGTWSCPGGLVDRGETPLEAAVRECCEELGIDVWTFADATRNIRVLRRAWKPGRGGYFTTFIAECDLRLDEIEIDGDETLEAIWAPVRIVRHLGLHPGLEETLDATRIAG